MIMIIIIIIINLFLNNQKLKNNYKKLLSQKKQSEIITGQVTEKLVPFLKDFPHNPQNVQFLGNPVDYIAFENDGVYIIEIKSANSRLTKKQRKIKNQIINKQVHWEEIRIK